MPPRPVTGITLMEGNGKQIIIIIIVDYLLQCTVNRKPSAVSLVRESGRFGNLCPARQWQNGKQPGGADFLG
jgi:hypothetical protein